jgi:hypothetical protein
MSATSPADPLDTYVRQLCAHCGHAFVWHGVGASTSDRPDLYIPQGCGVRGCRCSFIEPEEA